MEKITRVFMTGMLCLLVSGCNNSGNSTAAKEQQETLFNELNRAAEKCVERGNLQIDWQYAGQQDLKCDGKELEEKMCIRDRDNIHYRIPRRQQHLQAKKADINLNPEIIL